MNAAMSELSADLKCKASERCKNGSWNRSLLWQMFCLLTKLQQWVGSSMGCHVASKVHEKNNRQWLWRTFAPLDNQHSVRYTETHFKIQTSLTDWLEPSVTVFLLQYESHTIFKDLFSTFSRISPRKLDLFGWWIGDGQERVTQSRILNRSTCFDLWCWKTGFCCHDKTHHFGLKYIYSKLFIPLLTCLCQIWCENQSWESDPRWQDHASYT